MTEVARDRATGAVLFAIALVWTVATFWAVPGESDGAGLGPRGFPVGMGIALAVLSLLLIGKTFFSAAPADAEEANEGAPPAVERWALLATFGFLIVYLLMLEWFGFVLATVAVTAAFLWLVLRQRSPALLVGLPLGLGFGIWLVLGQLMGVYLPHGTIVSPF